MRNESLFSPTPLAGPRARDLRDVATAVREASGVGGFGVSWNDDGGRGGSAEPKETIRWAQGGEALSQFREWYIRIGNPLVQAVLFVVAILLLLGVFK
jgi:hypothetical protein